MKKIEILKLIEANQVIEHNKNLVSISKNCCFPQIEELKEEFDVLKKEIQIAIDKTEISKKYIQNIGCNHEIRLKHFGLFSHNSICVFCGKKATSDNCINWEYSINRNRYCVNLTSKYQDNEDYDYIHNGYTNQDAYEIILNILKDKKEDEEIDLVQEFKKLNLKECYINEEKKVTENYILIIEGSNKQYIGNESYLHKEGLKIGLDFVKYFSGLLNTKIELIDNREILESADFQKTFPKENHNLKFVGYSTIEEIEKILSWQKEIPFKIIIDLSELYEYRINDNNISKETIDIKLSEYFPNSYIIRIGNLSKRSLEELSKFLKNIHKFDKLYAYQNNEFYYLENAEIESDYLENICKKLKRLLRK